MDKPSVQEIDDLLEAAQQAGKQAHAVYSGFHVGAALLAEDGSVITGCNVENASYGLTICAERNAVFSAVARGHKRFRAIAIVAEPSEEPASPCGACRQVLVEFCDDLYIISSTPEGKRCEYTLNQLLPQRFNKPTA